MNEELKILLTVSECLETAGIAYIISGSMAANYYTVPRMTRDIDVVVELKRADIDRFIQIFEKDFWIDPAVVDQEVASRGMFNVIHKEYVIKVDFILRKDTPFQESAFERRKKITIEGQLVWLISAEDLILAKLLWAKDSFSELQLNDVRHLLKTVETLERDYLDKWILGLDLVKIYERAKP